MKETGTDSCVLCGEDEGEEWYECEDCGNQLCYFCLDSCHYEERDDWWMIPK